MTLKVILQSLDTARRARLYVLLLSLSAGHALGPMTSRDQPQNQMLR